MGKRMFCTKFIIRSVEADTICNIIKVIGLNSYCSIEKNDIDNKKYRNFLDLFKMKNYKSFIEKINIDPKYPNCNNTILQEILAKTLVIKRYRATAEQLFLLID